MSAVLMQGNEACAYGALAAGCRFYGGYPITPSTTIAEVLARELPKRGGRFIQMEDENRQPSSGHGCVGGWRQSHDGNQWPGVFVDAGAHRLRGHGGNPLRDRRRPALGPATGQPTSPSQGDMMQARWGTHGDHPIIALCPTSVRECFDLTVLAFNFSEKYRSPVILLMDEVVGHMREKVNLPAAHEIEVIDRLRPTVPPSGTSPTPKRPRTYHPWRASGGIPLPYHRPAP